MTAGTSVTRATCPARPFPAGTGPAPARLRLPRSPKILTGLGLLLALRGAGHRRARGSPPTTRTPSFHNAPVPLPPSAAHWLGTTQLQQDVLSQLLGGGRSTSWSPSWPALVATVLSVVIGVTAGYLGGLADDLLSMLANIFLVMPALPLLIVMFGFLPASGSSDDLLIGLIIAVTGWAWGARVLRAQTLSLRSRDFVESARIIGERGWRIIGCRDPAQPDPGRGLVVPVHRAVRGRHVHRAGLPRPGQPRPLELGRRCCSTRRSANAENSGYWWWFVPPGLAVALLGTALALLNFGIDEFINPRLRAAGLTRRRARRAGTGPRPPRRSRARR